MSRDKGDKPRTGDGRKAKGKKPSETGILQMRTGGPLSSAHATPQPKGWGIAKVVSILSGKKKR